MKNIFHFFLAILLLSSCEEKLANEQAREAIQNYYNEASLAAGNGTYHISTIDIISSEKQKDESWKIKAKVSGTHENYSLGENQGPFPIDYENIYTIKKEDKVYKVTSIE